MTGTVVVCVLLKADVINKRDGVCCTIVFRNTNCEVVEGRHGFGIGGKPNFQMLNRKATILRTPRFRFKKRF